MESLESVLKGKSILLVDDEEGLRDALAFCLVDAGCNVIEANGVDEAIEVLTSNSIDAIVSDVRMPEKKGTELLSYVRKVKKVDTPFLLMSGFSELTIEEAYSQGADCYLAKPFGGEVLLKSVSQCLTPMTERTQGQQPIPTCEVVAKDLTIYKGGTPGPRTMKVGRMGFFVPAKGITLKSGEIVSFHLSTCEPGSIALAGIGEVVWIRLASSPRGYSGIGLRVLTMENSSIQEWRRILKENPSSSPIPA